MTASYSDSVRIEGSYCDGQTSRSHSAYLWVNNDSIRITSVDEDDFEPLDTSTETISINEKMGRLPVVIRLDNGGSFTCPQHPTLDTLAKSLNQRSGIIHFLESHLAIVLTALVISTLSVAGGVHFGVPALSKYIAFSLPQSANYWSDLTLEAVDKAYFSPSELPLEKQAAVKTLLAPYLNSYSSLQPAIHFRHQDSANAFALMTGDIIFTDAFIELAEDDEILAVFLHEIGHLQNKHFLRRILQDSMVALLVILILGDLEVSEILVGIPTLLLDFSWSRQFESEADHFAIREMQRFGISVTSFVSVLQKLENSQEKFCKNDSLKQEEDDNGNINTWLRTHPVTQERIDAIRYQSGMFSKIPLTAGR